MKTLLTLLLTLLTSIVVFAQNTDSVYINKETDAMTDKTYYFANRSFIVKNDAGNIGFRVDSYIDDNIEFKMLVVTMVGIGNCNENDEIIILLENGKKVTKKSWKKFNCNGEAYFNLDKDDIEILKSSPISKIRMTNGRTYDSYTGDVKPKDKRYLIQLFYSLDNKYFTENKNK